MPTIQEMRSAAVVLSGFALAGIAHSAVPALAAGGGVGSAAGVAVAEIRYELDEGDGATAVSFTVSPSSVSLVRARVRPDAPYVTCRGDHGRWRCPLGGVPLERVQALAVVAADA